MNNGTLKGTDGISLLNPNIETFSDWEVFPSSYWLPLTSGWNTATMTDRRYFYKKVGSLVYLYITIIGTSNLATLITSVPAPFSIAFPGCTISTLIINAGTFGNGFAFIGQAASPRTLSFYTTLAAGTNWTASGQKGVYLNSWYITNE